MDPREFRRLPREEQQARLRAAAEHPETQAYYAAVAEEDFPMTDPTAPAAAFAATIKRADQLQTGDLLWRDESQQWHTVYALPEPIFVAVKHGFEKCVNLHTTPAIRPGSVATYPISAGQMVLAQAPAGELRAALGAEISSLHVKKSRLLWNLPDDSTPENVALAHCQMSEAYALGECADRLTALLDAHPTPAAQAVAGAAVQRGLALAAAWEMQAAELEREETRPAPDGSRTWLDLAARQEWAMLTGHARALRDALAAAQAQEEQDG